MDTDTQEPVHGFHYPSHNPETKQYANFIKTGDVIRIFVGHQGEDGELVRDMDASIDAAEFFKIAEQLKGLS